MQVVVQASSVTATVVVAALIAVASPSAHASCVGLSEAQERALADVIFDGVAVAGRTEGGVLVSPAHFRVTRYLKGAGPRVVEVTTAVEDELIGSSLNSTGIQPAPGSTWRIYARGSPDGVLETSICAGSKRLRGPEPPPVRPGTNLDDRIDRLQQWLLTALPFLLIALLAAAGVLVTRSRSQGAAPGGRRRR